MKYREETDSMGIVKFDGAVKSHSIVGLRFANPTYEKRYGSKVNH